MKYPFNISNFLEDKSSFSHSIVFLYFFALIIEEGFLISPCYSLELCIQMRAVTPQEIDPDLRMSVQESPVEMWVSSGLLQGWGH